MHYILDFDDTLALGPNTWAFENVLPDLIRSHNLPFEPKMFEAVMLKAQKDANEGTDDEELLNTMFVTLGWKDDLKSELLYRVFNDYQPVLFDDTIPFLKHLKENDVSLYIISNNNHAVQLAQMLRISDYFEAIITPDQKRSSPKPSREMFDVLKDTHTLDGDVFMVGDDPWSDGSFARASGIKGIIVDRLGRYQSLHADLPYRFVNDLSEISTV